MSAVCFGDRRLSTGTLATDKKFTGQRLDGTGLYYYNARYYDPSIGRFISADSMVPGAVNPQNFNRYSYCLNNPLRYIDPSGHDPSYTAESNSGIIWSYDESRVNQNTGGHWFMYDKNDVDHSDMTKGESIAALNAYNCQAGIIDGELHVAEFTLISIARRPNVTSSLTSNRSLGAWTGSAKMDVRLSYAVSDCGVKATITAKGHTTNDPNQATISMDITSIRMRFMNEQMEEITSKDFTEEAALWSRPIPDIAHCTTISSVIPKGCRDIYIDLAVGVVNDPRNIDEGYAYSDPYMYSIEIPGEELSIYYAGKPVFQK